LAERSYQFIPLWGLAVFFVVDEVRAEEVKRLKAYGYEPVLKHSVRLAGG
jgi:hypothetical protein